MANSIVFVVPCLRGGGAERVMVSLANEMINDNNRVTFLFAIDNIQAYELDKRVSIVYNKKKTNPLGQISFIRNYMKKNRDSVYISFFTYQNIYTLLANIFLNTKVIVSERNDPKKTLYGRRMLEKVRSYLYSKAYGVIFQTEDAKHYFSERIQQKGVIICNPLSPLLPNIYESNRDKRIVAVARLNKQKNLPMLISGSAGFLSEHPDYILEIYGEGNPKDADMRGELIELANDLGIGERVKLMGFVSNVTEAIRSASLYVSTSNYEGISNSMLEALALGIPCVCTDCPVGGARMFVKNGVNGYLVPVGDEKAFGEALGKALTSTEWGDSCNIEARKLRKQLSINNIVEEWLSVINGK